MPRKPIDYTNTHFYKLCCLDLTVSDIYIGHTTGFRKRKSQHKKRCCKPSDKRYNLKVYQFIRNTGGWENWDMVLIETRSCNNVLEAKKIERELLENMSATLNTQTPTRTKKEHYEANKDRILARQKQYSDDHKDIIRDRRKAFRENNKERLCDSHRRYYEQNKEQILEKMRMKVTCDVCNVMYNSGDRARHCRSLRHQKALEAQTHA